MASEEKPYEIEEDQPFRGSFAQTWWRVKSLVSDVVGPWRSTREMAEEDGVSFVKAVSALADGKIVPCFDDDAEVFCLWYRCLSCGCENISKRYKFCPGCGKELAWE